MFLNAIPIGVTAAGLDDEFDRQSGLLIFRLQDFRLLDGHGQVRVAMDKKQWRVIGRDVIEGRDRF